MEEKMDIKSIEAEFYRKGRAAPERFPTRVHFISTAHHQERTEDIKKGLDEFIGYLGLSTETRQHTIDEKEDRAIKEILPDHKKVLEHVMHKQGLVPHAFYVTGQQQRGSRHICSIEPSLGGVLHIDCLNREYDKRIGRTWFLTQIGFPRVHDADYHTRRLGTSKDDLCINKYDQTSPFLCGTCSTGLVAFLKGKEKKKDERYFR